MRFPYPLWTHKEQPEGRRHRIFLSKSLGCKFSAFDRPSGVGRKQFEILQCAVSISLRDLGIFQKPVRARHLDTFTTDNSLDAVSQHPLPPAAAALRTNLNRLRTHWCIVTLD